MLVRERSLFDVTTKTGANVGEDLTSVAAIFGRRRRRRRVIVFFGAAPKRRNVRHYLSRPFSTLFVSQPPFSSFFLFISYLQTYLSLALEIGRRKHWNAHSFTFHEK